MRYFSFNVLRSCPVMNIGDLNVYGLEGALYIAKSISFGAVAAIYIG